MSRVSAAVERFPGEGLRGRLLVLALLLAVSALPVLFLMPLFNAPFERDQGLYGVIARGWSQGAIPYRDLWDNKAHALSLVHGRLQLLGASSRRDCWPRSGLPQLCPSSSTPRACCSGLAGLFAALFFAIAFANPFLQANANAEILMPCPLVAGFWAHRGSMGGSQLWFAFAGVMTALAA
jgi:hypothetical protein